MQNNLVHTRLNVFHYHTNNDDSTMFNPSSIGPNRSIAMYITLNICSHGLESCKMNSIVSSTHTCTLNYRTILTTLLTLLVCLIQAALSQTVVELTSSSPYLYSRCDKLFCKWKNDLTSIRSI